MNAYGRTKLEAEAVIQVLASSRMLMHPMLHRLHIMCLRLRFLIYQCCAKLTHVRPDYLHMQSRWPEHCILRSSIIFGPQCPTPVPRALFLQFIDRALMEGTPTTFFDDEFRWSSVG